MTPKHRIVYVVGQLGGGGLERQLFYLLSAMDRDVYAPAVAVWDYDPHAAYSDEVARLGVAIYPVSRGRSVFGRLVSLRALIQRIAPEVVHSYSEHTNFPAWFASRGLRGVVLGHIQGDYKARRRNDGLIRGTLSRVFPATHIANSVRAKQDAESDQSWTSVREVVYVANGLDLDRFTFSELPQGSRFEIVGIGNLLPVKNWHDTLKALAEFGSRTVEDWRFRLCGTGPLEAELRRASDELSLNSHVEFLGFRKDVAEILASSHVMVLSSKQEGSPNAVLEAMAKGRPVVATDVGDVPRLIRDGHEGFVVAVGATEALAGRLLRLASDPRLRESMSRKARRRVESKFSLSTLVEDTLAVYRRLGWTG